MKLLLMLVKKSTFRDISGDKKPNLFNIKLPHLQYIPIPLITLESAYTAVQIK